MKIISSQEFTGRILHDITNRGPNQFSHLHSSVRSIVEAVKNRGDPALLHYTKKFDKVHISQSQLQVSKTDIKDAYQKLRKNQIEALKKAARNITRFATAQKTKAWSRTITEGVTLGQLVRPLSSVGIYAPGGKAIYPSSVLMCAIPAKVAGVETILVCSPPQSGGDIHPALLVAADIVGITKIFRVGGAQAIAAMAYGTRTIPQVDKIVGPGSTFVMTAKILVKEQVAIDLPAGPSEVLIIADEAARPSFVAADLIAQAEHDPEALEILLTTSAQLAETVHEEINKQIELLSPRRRDIAKSAIRQTGLIVVVKNMNEAIRYANLLAPEHLQIQTKNPEAITNKIHNAGSIFLGEYTPVALGDYTAGLNHVLPTGGYARYYSGLSTTDFLKNINFLSCDKKGFQRLKQITTTLAKLEGFDGHVNSVAIRVKNNDD